MTEQLEGQMNFLDLAGQSGRTCPEPSAATKAKISGPSSKRSPGSKKKETFLFLSLKAVNGLTQELSWETAGALPGGSTTLNFGAWPSEEKECTLSQILDLNAPEKYCLSVRACEGILRRAEKRGKILPDMLQEALTEVIRCG